MKCTNGHEILKGKTHCGACGAKGADAAEVQCAGCKGTFTKSADAFCGDCGGKLETIDLLGQHTAEIDVLNGFVKAAVDFEKGALAIPVVDEGMIDAGEIQDLLKSTQFDGPNGETQTDAAQLIGEVLKSVTHVQLEQRAFAEHHTKWNANIIKGVMALAGVVVTQGKLLAGMAEFIKSANGTTRGRRGLTRLTVDPTSDAAGVETDETETPDVNENTMVIAKCVEAMRQKAGVLSAEEFAVLHGYLNQPGTDLDAIGKINPTLFTKAQSAIRLIDGNSH